MFNLGHIYCYSPLGTRAQAVDACLCRARHVPCLARIGDPRASTSSCTSTSTGASWYRSPTTVVFEDSYRPAYHAGTRYVRAVVSSDQTPLWSPYSFQHRQISSPIRPLAVAHLLHQSQTFAPCAGVHVGPSPCAFKVILQIIGPQV